MSNKNDRNGADEILRPQVVVMETPKSQSAGIAEPLAPRIIATAQTGRIIPAPPAELQPTVEMRRRRHSLSMKLALTGLVVAFCGWLGVDLYLWIASAFNFSTGLGWAAATAAAVGISAATAMIVHEARSYFALKNVEINQQRLAAQRESAHASDVHETIRDVIREIPQDRESTAAIEAFQRKVQRHHSPAQQIELLSETVMTPLDRRAEAIVRRASARAFGITAISPAAVLDVLFFIACSVRMVREIAACYGHRPTVFATAHLLRRLVVEAGKLGAVDFAGVALTQTYRRRRCRTRGDERGRVYVCLATHGAAGLGDNGSLSANPVSAQRTAGHLVIIDRQLASGTHRYSPKNQRADLDG